MSTANATGVGLLTPTTASAASVLMDFVDASRTSYTVSDGTSVTARRKRTRRGRKFTSRKRQKPLTVTIPQTADDYFPASPFPPVSRACLVGPQHYTAAPLPGNVTPLDFAIDNPFSPHSIDISTSPVGFPFSPTFHVLDCGCDSTHCLTCQVASHL